MASRRDIIDAFYDELVAIATGTHTVEYDDGSTENLTLSQSDVNLIGPESLEDTQAVFFRNEAIAHIEYNGVGAGPDWVERDNNGNVVYSKWIEYAEAFFTVTIRMNNPAQVDPVYESIRRGFGKYMQGRWDESSLHEDVIDIRVESASPANSLDEDDAIWGTQLEVYVEFKRGFIVESGGTMTMDEAVEAVQNIAQVNLDLDVEMDDTVDYEYTIT